MRDLRPITFRGLEVSTIAAVLLSAAGLVMIPCLIHWLITPAREDLEANFETLTERNKR